MRARRSRFLSTRLRAFLLVPLPLIRSSAAVLLFAGIALAGAAGCSSRDQSIGGVPRLPISSDDEGGVDELPDSSLLTGELVVSKVKPASGPFVGGNDALVRGQGFLKDPEVTVAFGGQMVQPADTEVLDDRRIAVVVPAGAPGVADVEVTVGGKNALLKDGYTYESIDVNPKRGSVAGGTVLRIVGSGTAFAVGDKVRVGEVLCKDVSIISATELTCRTAPSVPGEVDVVVEHADASTDAAADVFTYYDGTDSVYGGLGGGPIAGAINVTVLDAFLGLPVPEAFVLVGNDLGAPLQGETDERGQITFSANDLVGPVTVHVAKDCFEKTTFVSFDATDVTVFLVPWLIPRCIPPSMGGGGGGQPVNGAFITGRLDWPVVADAFGGPWSQVPFPRANEKRVAYVFTTQLALEYANPPPGVGGVVEDPGPNSVPDDFAYSIFVRPAAVAVYALAGLENTVTRKFTPFVMGIERNVFPGPGSTVEGVNILMDIPLDRIHAVSVASAPAAGNLGPDRFRGRLSLDLGGAGLVVRNVNGQSYDEVTQNSAAKPFRFLDEPAPFGKLQDQTYRLDLTWSTGSLERSPLTAVQLTGVRFDAGPVVIDGLLGVPVAESPASGDRIPADRILRWSNTGGIDADFHIVLMVDSDGNPAWRHILPGDVFEAPVPDFSPVPGVPDIESGVVTWVVYAARSPGLVFDEFSYRYFETAYWSHYAYDVFTATRD
jgi:hypothetical protein